MGKVASGPDSGGKSGSLTDSGRPRLGSGSASGQSRSRGSAQAGSLSVGLGHLCTFEVGGQRYALSTSLVREIVEVERITRVPRTAAEVMGLFNLRGEPMPLVDLTLVLSGAPSPVAEKMSVIILRNANLSLGARIDALGTVVPNTNVIPTDDPNPLLLGFIDLAGEGPVAVIDANEFMSRIDGLRLANDRGSRKS